MKILDCELIQTADGSLKIPPQALRAYIWYCDKIGQEPLYRVWYDYIDDLCFGSDGDYSNAVKADTCFLSQREEFISHEKYGIPRINDINKSGYAGESLRSDREIIYEDLPILSKFKDKEVFIIGAGPSTSLIDLSQISADHIWVCNDFLKYKPTSELDVSLFYMSNTVQKHSDSYDYMKKNKKTICAFDVNVRRDFNLLQKYKEHFSERSFIYSLRLFTSAGSMPRLIALATLLGASKVLFVGMDGYPEKHYDEGKFDSVFEAGKKDIPTGLTYRSQCREYILFWDYMINDIGQNTSFVNLGKVYEHNLSKEVLPGVLSDFTF